MKKILMPYVAKLISSDAVLNFKRTSHSLLRTLQSKPASLDVFIKVDDPYSYLLIQALDSISTRFAISYRFHVFLDIDPKMFPQPEMWNQYARHDAYHLATLYELDFPKEASQPSKDKVEQIAFQLAALEQKLKQDLEQHSEKSLQQIHRFLAEAYTLLQQLWFNSSNELQPVNQQARIKYQAQLKQNADLLSQKGHYLGAMINYEGEWYWGLDRLDHLEQRLITQGLALNPNKGDASQVVFNKTYSDFCHRPPHPKTKHHPLTLYWSARSPYSYIALERAVQLAVHHQLSLNIKPVLPMVMRGMSVPPVKKMYIFLDTKREAKKLGLPYGFVADPLGAAVERCYALLEYAESQDKLQDFLLSFARGVNAEGIRAETDSGMKKIINRSGLDWATAKNKLNSQAWKIVVEKNLDDMFAIGCWGVPSIQYGSLHFWGQDRFGMLEKHIQQSAE